MYSRIKPKNLFISALEGIDFAGKTTTLAALKAHAIKASFNSQITKATAQQLCSKYDAPLQIAGSPLSDEFDLYYRIQTTNSQSYLQTEYEASNSDLYISSGYDCYSKLFLRLPHRGVPSYEAIQKVLSGEVRPKRREYILNLFVKNYHEAMNLVWGIIEKQKSVRCLLFTDRSWVSNLVYNEHPETFEKDKLLVKKLNKIKPHVIDYLTLLIIDQSTLESRLNNKSLADRSVFERRGVLQMMKMQDYYLYLIEKLNRLGYIIEYTIMTSESSSFIF